MKDAFTVFAVLLVAGLFNVPALDADSGGDYSEPPAAESGTVVLTDAGGDYSEPPVVEDGSVVLAESGGDLGGQPVVEGWHTPERSGRCGRPRC